MTCGLPNLVRVKGSNLDFTASLYVEDNDPNTSKALFPTHSLGSQVDVTALPLPANVDPPYALERRYLIADQNELLPIYVGRTCYIIGFPEGLIHEPFANITLPIWKTGHIASEPVFPFDGQPKLVIDATTRRGMSGSMVMVLGPVRDRLIGIYTGRYRQRVATGDVESSRNFTAELGWVFWPSVINELIGD